MRSFNTENDPGYSKRLGYITIGIIFIVLSLLASLALLISLKTFLLFEAIVIFSCGYAALARRPDTIHYSIRFENDTIYLTDIKRGTTTEIFDIFIDDIELKQSESDKKRNTGMILIKPHYMVVPYVKNFEEMKKYIQENFI